MKNILQKGVTGYTLKVIALLFMILDHVHSYLQIGPSWINIITRFVAPLFVYFLVEGFYHTHNRLKYALRLTVFALLMFLGNAVINFVFGSTDPFSGKMTLLSLLQGNNIFLTLACFMYLMMLLEKSKTATALSQILAGIFIAIIALFSLFFGEGTLYLLPILFICYYGYGNKKRVCSGIAIWSLLLLAKALMSYWSGGTGLTLWETLAYDAQWAMIFTIIPILLYNGQRGKNTLFAKWLFYIIYPLHIWLLMILSYMYVR